MLRHTAVVWFRGRCPDPAMVAAMRDSTPSYWVPSSAGDTQAARDGGQGTSRAAS